MAKVLSVKQPWASLLVYGVKDIENRTWSTKYRGKLLIHSSKTALDDLSVLTDAQRNECIKAGIIDEDGNELIEFPKSAIIGSVELYDCVKEDASIWKENGSYGFKMRNAEVFSEPILNVKGNLGIWEKNFLKNSQ